MPNEHNATRRMLLTALAGFTVANIVPSPAVASDNRHTDSRILVAYFSRSGNTRVIAGIIQRSLQSDMIAIEPVTPYPQDYFQTVDQATNERERGITPPLTTNIANIGQYQTIYLGFPVWGMSVPPVVQSFLRRYDLTGKILIPFITHGGYGTGDSETVLARLASGARREQPLVIQCDQERRTTETVTRWLKETRMG